MASIVLPVPGGPAKSAPLGTFAPIFLYFYGDFKKSALPEFREIYGDFNKQDPKQIRQKIFEQNNLTKEILKLLHVEDFLTTDEIRKTLKISRTSASLVLNRLEKEQLVTKDRVGKSVSFTLTHATKDVMKDLYEPSILVKFPN